MNNIIKFSSINSLIFYLLVFIASTLFIALDKNKKNKKVSLLVIVGLSILVFISTFRYGVGTDYFNYEHKMNSQKSITLCSYVNEEGINEIGNFITDKVGNLFDSYNIVLCIRAILVIFTIYFAVWQHRDKSIITIGMFLFMCIYLPSFFNISTQFIAIGIVALSYRYIFEKNIIMFLFTVFIASLFHTTALLVFPIYFLWDKHKGTLINKVAVIIAIALCILIVKYIPILLESFSEFKLFESYGMYSTLDTVGSNRDIYIKILLFSVIFIFKDPLIKHDNRNELYILLILFNLIIGLSGRISPWIKRMGLYFEITQIFILPGFIKMLKNNKEKNLVGYTICLYGIGYFTLVYYILRQANVIPYRIMF